MFVFCLERGVKPIKILRFYFGAGSLERALDHLITDKALNFEGDTLDTAERLCEIIGEKIELEKLWEYLDGVLAPLSAQEREVLALYSARRDFPLSDAQMREAKRAVIKFTRHARKLAQFGVGFEVLDKYYCLIGRS